MKEIRSLASLEGRAVVRDIFRELRFEKQVSGFTTITTMWRICTNEKDVFRYSNHEARVLHPLGTLRGTSLWMQEVINRFYYSTINSFVYFGAAILLIIIGFRRFTDYLSDEAVLASIGFEAFLLVLVFVVMYFTPMDDVEIDTPSNGESDELLREIGEIGRDYAGTSTQIEQAVARLESIAHEQSVLAHALQQSAENNAHAVAPNPQLLSAMKETNSALLEFKQTIVALNESAKKLEREEIERAVRSEVERILRSSIAEKR